MNPLNSKPLARRTFLRGALTAALSLPILAWISRHASTEAVAAGKDVALPAGKSAVPETDPVAMALGYKADKGRVDGKQYPQVKKPAAKDQFCKSCSFYAKANEGWGQCQMLQSGLVAAGGWCASWQKKA